MTPSRKTQIEALLGPAVDSLGLEIWGLELALSRGGGLLRVYIDHPGRAVTLDDCEAVSREVSALLDVHDPIAGNYTLEVSSPGIDRPLFRIEQYQRYIGEDLRVQTSAPIAGRRKFSGTLTEVSDTQITLAMEGGQTCLDIADIDKARLVGRLPSATIARKPRGGKKTDD